MNDLHKRPDRTVQAVTRQLQAFGCDKYEIGVKAVEGSMLERVWSAREILYGIAWLKAVNARDHDIYIRPAGSLGLILIDDLNETALARIKEDGLPPAVVVETSPKNFQAWIRVSQEPIAPALATAVARILAERYGGDPNSANFRHFGRLVGFTNRKPKHRQTNGMQPYVLLHEAHGGGVAKRGVDILHEAEARLRATAEAQPAANRVLPAMSLTPTELETPGEAYAHYAELILARYPRADVSRLDWMVCRDLASGNLAVDEIYLQQALIDGSPQLAERKAGHIDDYVKRTAHKVMHDSKVTAARERLATSHAQRETRREL